ncbi:MAG: Hsp20/alpha crystallin family protein [Pseudomonadota bacterium]
MSSGRGGKTQIEQGLEAILGALGDALDEISRRAGDPEGGEIHHVRTFDTEKGPLRAEAGLRVRFAGDSHTGVRRPAPGAAPGRRRPPSPSNAEAGVSPAQPTKATTPMEDAGVRAPDASSAIRSMDLDISERHGAWHLLADVPGVKREDVTVTLRDGMLRVRADGRRIYEAHVPCPDAGDPDRLVVTVNNGILEIVLPLAKGDGP